MTEVQDHWARTVPLGGMLGSRHNGRHHLLDQDYVWPNVGTDRVTNKKTRLVYVGNRTLDNALGEFVAEH